MLSGRRLDLIDPSPLDVEIGDIAHGLARVARWNGQTQGPEIFSVAQHSLLVEALFAAGEPAPAGKARLTALLHDAPEYVIGDMISPFKAAIGGDYKLIEERLKRAIHIRFGLAAEPPDDLTRSIKVADRVSAYLEATALAGFSIAEARKLFGAPDLPLRDFAAVLEPMRPAAVEARFLARFAELDAAAAGDSIEAPVSGNAACPAFTSVRSPSSAKPWRRPARARFVTLLSPGTEVERPTGIRPERHLYLAVSDIVEPLPGQILPAATHLEELLGFVRAWDRAEPMVIHCFAGVSRSTAAAYIAACALKPGGDEFAIARAIRAASPTASPNPLLVALRRRGARPARADEGGDRRHRPRRGVFRGDAVHAGAWREGAQAVLPSNAGTFARWASRRSSSRSICRRCSSFSSPSR